MRLVLLTILMFFATSSFAGGSREMYIQDLEYQVEYLEQRVENQLPQDNQDPYPYEDEQYEKQLEYDRKMLEYYQERLQQVR